jgi:hypothetical protein
MVAARGARLTGMGYSAFGLGGRKSSAEDAVDGCATRE